MKRNTNDNKEPYDNDKRDGRKATYENVMTSYATRTNTWHRQHTDETQMDPN